MIMHKGRIVFWSGGYDSTLLVWKEAQRAKDDRTEVVSTWSLRWDRLDEKKMESERLCREAFTEFVKSELKVTIVNKSIDFKHEINPGGDGSMQAALFVPLCAYLAPEDSTILFGFHKGDDYWQTWHTFDYVRRYIAESMHKEVSFEFPLQGMKKYVVIQEIRRLGLERFCWTCETPDGVMRECGNCIPCRNKKVAEFEMTLNGVSDNEGVLLKKCADALMPAKRKLLSIKRDCGVKEKDDAEVAQWGKVIKASEEVEERDEEVELASERDVEVD
jgi:7-cyano-7-deazaguanine synthase in queuosine biosynthesis